MKIVTTKSKYSILELQEEDLISFTYSGVDLENKQAITIINYKKDYLSTALVHALIKGTEKLFSIKHPNILQPLDYYYEGHLFYVIYSAKEKYITIEEFIKKGTKPSLKRIWKQTTQIISGLLELEKNKIVHGCINLNTILVNTNLDIKLSKIYLHYLVYSAIFKQLDVVDYCIFYPPEFIQYQEYTVKSDIYSFGMLLYAIFSHQWPYKYTSNITALKKELLKKPAPFKKSSHLIPDKLGQIIALCIRKNAKNRIPSFRNFIKIYRYPENIKEMLQLKSVKGENILIDIRNSLRQMKKENIFRKIKYSLIFIFLTVSFSTSYYFYMNYLTGVPDSVIPNIVGLEKEEAIQVLRENKLKSVIMGKRPHPHIPKEHVISSRPGAGRLVKQYRMVKVFLSDGSKQFLVPDLIGRNLEQAKLVLPDHINYKIKEFVHSSQYQKGIVLNQTPTANSFMNVSDNIKIVVSSGFPVTMSVNAATPGLFQDKSHLRKVNISFSILENWLPQDVAIFFNNKGSSDKIYSEFHFPNDQVNVAFELEYRGFIEIYFDGEMGFRERILDPPPPPIIENIASKNEDLIMEPITDNAKKADNE
jgi:eukaryotic-like serine/threonine-protein kinase